MTQNRIIFAYDLLLLKTKIISSQNSNTFSLAFLNIFEVYVCIFCYFFCNL